MKLKFYLFVIAMLFSFGRTSVLWAEAYDGKAVFILKKGLAVFNEALGKTGEERRLDMLKAAGLFQSLGKKFGFENGELYYNIGNAYYEAGDMGRAILNYRRAERLIPGSENLKYNLRQALRSLNLSEEKEDWSAKIGKRALFWHFSLDYDARRLIFFISFSSLWLFLTWRIFQKNFFSKAGVVISLLMVCAFGGSYLTSAYYNNLVKSGVVLSNNAVARKGPGAGYQTFYSRPLIGGTEFRLIEKQGDWAEAELFNGDKVWLEIEDIELI